FSRRSSAFSVSDCECTETYSPAAIAIAPDTRPATPATTMFAWLARALATPIIRLAVETMPSLAPRTAARSQPMRPMTCGSLATDQKYHAALADLRCSQPLQQWL